MNKPSPVPVNPNSSEGTTGTEAAGMQNWSLAHLVLHKPLALICGGFLLLIILGAIFAPLIAPYPPNALD